MQLPGRNHYAVPNDRWRFGFNTHYACIFVLYTNYHATAFATGFWLAFGSGNTVYSGYVSANYQRPKAYFFVYGKLNL